MCDTCFAGIQMKTHTWAFYCEVQCPSLERFIEENHFQSDPEDDLHESLGLLPNKECKLDTDEIDQVYLINVKHLKHLQSPHVLEKMPRISYFHWFLLLHAYSLLGGKHQASDLPLPNVNHVKEFQWTV
jgi:hypothetical protein